MCHKLAAELNITYEQAIDAEGHGNSHISGYSSTTKSVICCEFRNNAKFEPKAMEKIPNVVLLYQMEDGKHCDVANVCQVY